MSFGIKDGYRENPVEYFLDNLVETRGILFQPDVYAMAELLVGFTEPGPYDQDGPLDVVDVGCGYGDKLAAMQARHGEWTFYGLDFGANIEHCRKTYDWGTWIETDFETIEYLKFPGSVMICSDVIEHLADPRPLLKAMRESRANIVLSTPERDLQHGLDHMGPSPNINHVREWNYEELHAFLEAEGFTIRFHGLTRSSDAGPYCQTQLVVM